jgi:hypothetical protein
MREIIESCNFYFIKYFALTGIVIKLRKIYATLNRLLHTSFLVFAMTDHFLRGEGGEKEASGDSAITEN